MGVSGGRSWLGLVKGCVKMCVRMVFAGGCVRCCVLGLVEERVIEGGLDVRC